MTVALLILLAGAAAIHLVWAAGLNWPIRDEAQLAKAVVGAQGITKMPPRWASALVALALGLAMVLIAAQAGWLGLPLGPKLMQIAIFLMVAVFALRGLAGYLPVWRQRMEPRFDRLNARFYSPLCLLIATLTVLQI
ncbi:DUF3995 domain-containing protein [Aliiroseovarius crassostreae]|uniref:DUF3995 domain-containing protein n=1 Tax=Aliiroseovarius crassostreae TaxID=154981 RepID=UPI003C7E603F